MNSLFLCLGAISAFLGVSMGAFGAHALKTVLSSDMLEVYKTAVSYQMWHALGLIAIAFIPQASESALVHWAGWLMFAGTLLFSGSLYLLTIFNLKWLGMITPIGGVAFLSAWLLIAIFAVKTQS
ncbi:DUF423 domain-containing protein [Methylobacter luteus]|uniref:DUF423 domain-containing protein n=1 Tax=Methylobacter luteus TaxID=415 RepID=UPI00041FAFD4|nr:DUF423 domain-containing protein [Methylobacter luteus]